MASLLDAHGTPWSRAWPAVMYINITVISVMAYNLNVVANIMVIVRQVPVFVCSAREKKKNILRYFNFFHLWWYFSTDENVHGKPFKQM